MHSDLILRSLAPLLMEFALRCRIFEVYAVLQQDVTLPPGNTDMWTTEQAVDFDIPSIQHLAVSENLLW